MHFAFAPVARIRKVIYLSQRPVLKPAWFKKGKSHIACGRGRSAADTHLVSNAQACRTCRRKDTPPCGVSLYRIRMNHLFFIQAVLIAVVGAVHIAAMKLYLYWLFPWLDVFVHFGGALWVALAAIWLLTAARQKSPFATVFSIIVVLSIGWEFFELWGGIPREANFAFDTSLDLLMDAFGGIAGYAMGKRLIRRGKIDVHGTA